MMMQADPHEPMPKAAKLQSHGHALLDHGYAVLPCVASPAQLQQLQQEWDSTVRGFPEYADAVADHTYVLGGFAALGNPGSFHNPLVRRLREYATAVAVPALWAPYVRAAGLGRGVHLEQLVDRMLHRPPGAAASAERCHRDEGRAPCWRDDRTYGGWINLDSQTQHFCCLPGSHRETNHRRGMVKPAAEMKAEFESKKERVAVPPGHLLVFYEHILHEITVAKLPYASRRLFVGWRLTRESLKPLLYASPEIGRAHV
jgi:hypothetical protein